jgi:TRAP-type C4-dicarboxylate transport system permease large subunit
MIMAMGVSAFAPPLGVGLYIACSVCDTRLEVAMRRMFW